MVAIDIDKTGYLRTRNGIIQMIIVFLAFLGGIINILSASLSAPFLTFLFWSTFFISGALLLTNVFAVHSVIVAKITIFTKVEFGYKVIWALFYLIALIMSFVPLFFGSSSVIAYFSLAAMAADLFFHYRIYRSGSGEGPANPAETVEQA